jgi:hypothetical protein
MRQSRIDLPVELVRSGIPWCPDHVLRAGLSTRNIIEAYGFDLSPWRCAMGSSSASRRGAGNSPTVFYRAAKWRKETRGWSACGYSVSCGPYTDRPRGVADGRHRPALDAWRRAASDHRSIVTARAETSDGAEIFLGLPGPRRGKKCPNVASEIPQNSIGRDRSEPLRRNGLRDSTNTLRCFPPKKHIQAAPPVGADDDR